jgi:integrase
MSEENPRRPKGIKVVRYKDQEYHYDRLLGGRPIIAAPYSRQYYSEIETTRAERGIDAKKKGTFGHLTAAYRRSSTFASLAERTRADYQLVFDFLRPLDGMPVARIDAVFIVTLREEAFDAGKGRGRRFCNYVVQVISAVFAWGASFGLTPRQNPAHGIPDIPAPHGAPEANRAWDVDEVEVVFAEARRRNPCLLPAMALSYYAALREGHVLLLPHGAYRHARIRAVAQKNGHRLWIPAHPKLQEILDPLPRIGETIIVNKYRLPYTEDGFRGSFFKLIRSLERSGLVDDGLTFHGLRTSCGTNLAEAGCTTREIMSVLGVTQEMAEHYTREAEQRRLAENAIAKLVAADRNTT